MEAGSSSGVGRSQNTFPCVIGNKYPEYCNKSFPTIAKHNKHLRRSHSPEYWCEVCSKNFDSSLPRAIVRVVRAQHEKGQCPGQSSEENRRVRSCHFVMSQEQFKRLESWRKVPIRELAFGGCKIETLPEMSWRRVREAIFPDSSGNRLKTPSFDVLATSGIRNVNLKPRQNPLHVNKGYESVKRDEQVYKPCSVQEEGPIEAKPIEAQQHIRDSPPVQDMAAFPGASNMSATELDDLKSELPERLYSDLCQIDPAFNSVATLSNAIPSLLRSFAIRLGSSGSSKVPMEIMLFVYKNRDKISAAFSELVEDSNHQEDSSKSSDKSSAMLDDAILDWRANIESGEVPTVPQPDIEDLDPVEERPSVMNEGGYRELVFNSVAYKWLVAGLVQKLTLEVADVNLDVHRRIHRNICRCFKHSRHISRQKPPKKYQITFVVGWNPTAFLRQQFESPRDIGRLLGETLTLTGTATDAQILPCSEYMRQTWPTTGPTFLELLGRALVSDEHVSGELEDDTTVRCEFKKSGLTVQVKGITDSIATIGEQISWLGAALRPSSSATEFATCRPIFGTCNPSISKSRTAECFIAFLTTPMGVTKDTPGQCWHAIFRNPVMVEGYPIPRHKRYGSGLEMPLNVMAGLNSSPRIHKYGGNYYLKGYSTALVPTEKIGNMVLWHFYYSDDGSRLPYPNPTGLRCVDLSMQDLTAARHVVGWCSNANFKTGAADMNYAIGASKLQRPGKEFALEKISFSFGQFITGGCQFAIGRKDQHVRATKGTYIDKLKWLDKKYVTLWDVEYERGWLVNGNAALLHLLRSSLHHSSTDKFSSDFHFQPQNFQESKNPHTLDSALEVLRNSKNQQLELYDRDVDIRQGCATNSRTTVKDRVEELYEILEKLFDHTATSEASSKGLNAKSRFQDHLEGWDFTDIATNRDPFFIKRTTLGLSMLGWPDLVRATSAITLFGKGFGELIEAVGAQQGGACKEWMTMPKNRNLLCVSSSHLKDIINDVGGDLDTTPITVMPGTFWKVPSSTNTFDISCQCDTRESSPGSHHAVQSLISTKLWIGRSQACVNLDDHPHGAVIFGPLIDRKRPWGSSVSIPRSESQSSSLSALGGSTTSAQTNTSDLASPSSSFPASSAEPQGQNISGASAIGSEASPPAPGFRARSLSPPEEGLGTRELRRFWNLFPYKKARRH